MPRTSVPRCILRRASALLLSCAGLATGLSAAISTAGAQGTGDLATPPKWFPIVEDVRIAVDPAVAPSTAQATPGGAVPPEPPSEGEPLWEAGVGAFATYGPDYPASGEYSPNGLPFPFLIYRGDFLRLGEDAAAKIVPLETDRVEFSISLNAAFGADSDDNDLRTGLPDLDPLFELGPELIVRGPRFDFGPRGTGRVELALQARSVFSVDIGDFDPAYRGLVFEPEIRYRQPGLLGPTSILFASLDPIFATEELHDYFYAVDPAFALPNRPAFEAEGGYLGTTVGVGVGFQVTPRLSLFTGAEIGIYAGAANADSPLFEDEITGSAFFGFSYALYQSDARVTRR